MKRINTAPIVVVATTYLLTLFVGMLTAAMQLQSLTYAEKEYLSQKKMISMCVDPDWMPYEKIENGQHIGISADYMRLFSKIIDTPIRLVVSSSWSESLAFAKSRKCDIFSLAMPTPERSVYMNFTQPYLSIPLVITTTPEKPFVTSFTDVLNKKLGIVKGYAFAELLKTKYPNITLVEVESLKEGLDAVTHGQLFGFIDTLSSVGYMLQKHYLSELKINGKFDEKWELGVGTRNDEPLLNDIFNHAIASLNEQQNREIFNSWISIEYKQDMSYLFMLKIFAIVSIALSFLAYRQYRLKKYNQLLESLSVTDNLTSLYNRVKTDSVLKQQLERLEKYNNIFSIILLDIDKFKKINDTFGHLIGDEVLVHIAKLIKENCRKTDVIGRWGGEEFLIICPNTSINSAARLAEKLRQLIASTNIKNVDVVTISIGVTEATHKDNFNAVIKRADDALFLAKKQGRNQICIGE